MLKHVKFTCEICGLESEDESEIITCEAGHQSEKEITVAHAFQYPTGDPLPDHVELSFANGSKALYELKDIYTHQPEAQEDLETKVGEFEDGSPMILGDEHSIAQAKGIDVYA